MYIRNGQPFDINVFQTIEDNQYPAGWFHEPDNRDASNVFEVDNPVAPAVESGEKAELVRFVQNGTQWEPEWEVRVKTEEELAAEASKLSLAKEAHVQLINQWRDSANSTTFPHNGKHVAIDSLSTKDIVITTGYIALFGTFPPDWPGGWKYTDNTYEPMPTIEEFKAMFHSLASKGSGNFSHAQALKARVAAATSEDELQAIVW